jgi:hypothetical protein
VNDAPVAVAQAVSVESGTAKSITLAGSDVEGSAMTYTVVTQPSKGVLSGTGATKTYTPNVDVSGSDSFSFKVNDGIIDSAVVTVAVSISATQTTTGVEFTAGSLSGLTTGQTVVVPVTVKRFGGVTSFQFSLNWNPLVLEYVEVKNYGILGFTTGSFGTQDKALGRLGVIWSPEDGEAVTLVDGGKLLDVVFKVVGSNGTSTSINFGDQPVASELYTNFDFKSELVLKSGTIVV